MAFLFILTFLLHRFCFCYTCFILFFPLASIVKHVGSTPVFFKCYIKINLTDIKNGRKKKTKRDMREIKTDNKTNIFGCDASMTAAVPDTVCETGLVSNNYT